MVAQVVVELARGGANRLVQDIAVVVEERAAFEDRAALVLDQGDRRKDNRLVGETFEVVCVDVRLCLESAVLEVAGEGNLVLGDRVEVGLHLRQVVPVVLECLTLHQGAAVDVEMGLQVARVVKLVNFTAILRRRGVEPCGAPEV